MECSSSIISQNSFIPNDILGIIFLRLKVQDQLQCQKVCKLWHTALEEAYVSPQNKKEQWASLLLPNLAKLPLPIKQALGGMYNIYILPSTPIDIDKLKSTYHESESRDITQFQQPHAIMRGEFQKRACIVMDLFCSCLGFSFPVAIGHDLINPTLNNVGQISIFDYIFVTPMLQKESFEINDEDSDEDCEPFVESPEEITIEEHHLPLIQKILEGQVHEFVMNTLDEGETLNGSIMLNSKEIQVSFIKKNSVFFSLAKGLIDVSCPSTEFYYLIENSDINEVDENGNTALHIAIAQLEKIEEDKIVHHMETLDVFFGMGPDCNIANNKKQTPLHLAVELIEGCISTTQILICEIIEKLLDNGAQINQQDGKGNTVMQLAIESKNADCINLLKEREKRTSM